MPKIASRKPVRRVAPAVCPVCGEEVPCDALACPECGADERSGWREGALAHDGAGLAEEDFDHDQFVEEEFGSGVKPLIFCGGFWTV